jgi:hypothetical protein
MLHAAVSLALEESLSHLGVLPNGREYHDKMTLVVDQGLVVSDEVIGSQYLRCLTKADMQR